MRPALALAAGRLPASRAAMSDQPEPQSAPTPDASAPAESERCYRCFWPKRLCWCGSIRPMATRTKIVILIHPKEWKEQRTGTGRLTHLCLADSELIMGVGFDEHERVQELINDPANFPMLLYPGPQARALPEPICSSRSSTKLAIWFPRAART